MAGTRAIASVATATLLAALLVAPTGATAAGAAAEESLFTVVGIEEYSGGRDSLGGSMIVSFHESVAAELMLGKPGVFTSIDVTVNFGGDNKGTFARSDLLSPWNNAFIDDYIF